MLVFLPIILFILLFAPYLFLIPANDGNLEFILSNNWLLNHNRFNLLSLHPPVKYVLFSLFYQLFGYQNIGFVGLVLGIAGIYALYVIAKKLFDEKIAVLSSILLATSGLYLSVGLFSVHDFLITVFILLAFACYLYSRPLPYIIFASLAVLTKETAIFFSLSILFSELFIKKKISLTASFPLIAFAWYLEYLHFSGNHLWNAWNFSTTAKQGSIYTMINNMVTFQFLNKYAYENWLHLFVFNFNWVYWIFAFISLFYIKQLKTRKGLLPIGLFFCSFILMALSFQTFTINRYILPLLPFLYLFAVFGVSKMRFMPVFATLLIIVSLISLTQSIDPLSNMIWQKTQIFGEKVYLKYNLDGYDGITYNMQYLMLMKERTDMIKSGDCQIPPSIHYEKQTLALFQINTCN